jgi:F420-0:gamma-glutamyl ligase-like protein
METDILIAPNPRKKLSIDVDGNLYQRIPIRTHVITVDDDISKVCAVYAKHKISKDDLLFISERVVAITQGRAYRITDIKVTWAARILAKFVHRSPYGIGLGSEYTMQLAISEAGLLRILVAAAVSAIGKLFGIKGLFYHVVGNNINAIDGPCDYTLPPYNEFAKLGPLNPSAVAKDLSQKLGCEVVIIDANDLGVNVLGKSSRNISTEFCRKVFRDNPLGQSLQQTPLCIVRLESV